MLSQTLYLKMSCKYWKRVETEPKIKNDYGALIFFYSSGGHEIYMRVGIFDFIDSGTIPDNN